MTVEEKELKHLGFVPAAATSAIATAEPYYTNLKSNAGMLKEHVESVEKAVMEYGVPCYEKYMPYILETVDGQVDYAILFGMQIYDAGKARIAIAQSALEKASDNMRAAREKVTSAFHTDSLNTFYDAREAYKAKLNTYLAAMKDRGEKLPSTIAHMIASNVTYLREAIVSLKDQPTVAPYIGKATEYYSSSVQPYVETAITKVRPYVDTAITKVQPYVQPYLPAKLVKAA